MSENGFAQIEREAREQVSAELDARAALPEFGERIAWAITLYGRTDELSPVHRVGLPNGKEVYTACGEAIPSARLWLPLTDRLVRTMPRCRFCEAEFARLAREQAA